MENFPTGNTPDYQGKKLSNRQYWGKSKEKLGDEGHGRKIAESIVYGKDGGIGEIFRNAAPM